jgi:hypothetical protein
MYSQKPRLEVSSDFEKVCIFVANATVFVANATVFVANATVFVANASKKGSVTCLKTAIF